jgi:hypothetical protein
VHKRPAVVESPADGSFGVLATYREMPADADWRDEITETGKARRVCRRLANRNILVRTVFGAFVLVNKGGADYGQIFNLRFTGKAASNFYNNLDKALGRRGNWVRDENGQLHPLPLFGVYTKVTSELASNDHGDWYAPGVKIDGLLGQPNGPTEEEITTALEIYNERVAWTATSYDPLPELEGPPDPGPESAPVPIAPASVSRPALQMVTTGRQLVAPNYDQNDRPFAPVDSYVDEGEDIDFLS